MLKAAGRTKSGRPLILLGLTGENMTRLMAGEPILIHAHTLGTGFPEMTAVLIGGRTEEALRDDARTLVAQLDTQLDEPDRMSAYRAAREWAAEHGHQAPDDRMIDAALDQVYPRQLDAPARPDLYDHLARPADPTAAHRPGDDAVTTGGLG